MISKEIFTPSFQKLGYELAITDEKDLDILKNYGGIFFINNDKKVERKNATICSCGLKYDYTVSTCFFCGNTQFNQQTSFNRKNKKDIFTSDKTFILELTDEEKDNHFHNVLRCELAVINNFYDFESKEYSFNVEKIVIHIKKYHKEGENARFRYYEEDRETEIDYSVLAKKLQLNSRDLSMKLSNLIYHTNKDVSIETPVIIETYKHDKIFKKIPTNILRESSLEHFFMNGDDIYSKSSFVYMKEELYDFNKEGHEFFKIPKVLYDYLIEKDLNHSKKVSYYSPYRYFNQFNIFKLQRTKKFYTEDLFLTHLSLKNYSPNSLYRLYEMINHKTKPHLLVDLLDYIDKVKEDECVEDIDEIVKMYSLYVKKSKSFTIYPKNLTLEVKKIN